MNTRTRWHLTARHCGRAVLIPVVAVMVASCAHRGPATVEEVSSPDSPIVMDPILEDVVGIPETSAPVTTFTQDGRLQLHFRLQNQTDKTLRIAYQATFYDEAGVPVDDQGQRPPQFLKPAEVVPFTVTAGNRAAKTVQVQIRPAR